MTGPLGPVASEFHWKCTILLHFLPRALPQAKTCRAPYYGGPPCVSRRTRPPHRSVVQKPRSPKLGDVGILADSPVRDCAKLSAIIGYDYALSPIRHRQHRQVADSIARIR